MTNTKWNIPKICIDADFRTINIHLENAMKDEFEVLLGHDEVSEDESEGDLLDLDEDEVELDPDDYDQAMLDELFDKDVED